MKICEQNETHVTDRLDMNTIRQRVADIKRNWTPDTVRSRAIEGRRRRKELEAMVAQIEMALIEEFSEPELSLVG